MAFASTSTRTGRTAHRSGADAAVERIVDAALACFARVGVSKTTLEDIATAAGVSRATLYRYFPGKRALLESVVRHEVARVAAALDDELAGAATLEDVLTGTLTFAGREFADHETLQYVLVVEPETVLPHITFDGAGEVFTAAGAVLAPHLRRHVADDANAARMAQWVARVAFTYLFCPSDAVSLTDEASVRSLVGTFVLPAFDPTRRG